MQLVKVPLSEAVWSTWRRYCDALGVTMGAGIAGLIAHELGTLVNQMDADWKRLRDRVKLAAAWVWVLFGLAVTLLFFVVVIGGALGLLGERTGNMKPTTGTCDDSGFIDDCPVRSVDPVLDNDPAFFNP